MNVFVSPEQQEIVAGNLSAIISRVPGETIYQICSRNSGALELILTLKTIEVDGDEIPVLVSTEDMEAGPVAGEIVLTLLKEIFFDGL